MLKDRGHVDGMDLVDDLRTLLTEERIAELEAEVAQLREALARRQLYGVVTGVLAVRYRISPERAWQVMVRISQHNNLKVQVLARVMHGRFFGRLSPEDQALATRLDAQLGGQLRPVVLANGDGKPDDERG